MMSGWTTADLGNWPLLAVRCYVMLISGCSSLRSCYLCTLILLQSGSTVSGFHSTCCWLVYFRIICTGQIGTTSGSPWLTNTQVETWQAWSLTSDNQWTSKSSTPWPNKTAPTTARMTRATPYAPSSVSQNHGQKTLELAPLCMYF